MNLISRPIKVGYTLEGGRMATSEERPKKEKDVNANKEYFAIKGLSIRVPADIDSLLPWYGGDPLLVVEACIADSAIAANNQGGREQFQLFVEGKITEADLLKWFDEWHPLYKPTPVRRANVAAENARLLDIIAVLEAKLAASAPVSV